MSLSHAIGYGQFRLKDFHPGELCARNDGSLVFICDPQPRPEAKCRVQVLVDYGTRNAHREFWHHTALVHAVNEEQASRIEGHHRRAWN